MTNIDSKKSHYKLATNIRGYWYKCNPNTNESNSNSDYPIFYSFAKDEKGSPLIKTLNLSLEMAFTLLAIQKKIPLEDFGKIWSELYKDKNIPNFEIIIDNLLESKLIALCSHR